MTVSNPNSQALKPKTNKLYEKSFESSYRPQTKNINQVNQSNSTISSDKLSVGSLNVCGLKGRILYTEFTDLVQSFDIFCMSETKLLDTDVISCPGYTFFSPPRQQKFYRRSGRTVFLVRDSLVKFVAIIESKSEYIALLKLSKQCLGTDQDIMTATVYIPPQTSRFFSEDEYDLL